MSVLASRALLRLARHPGFQPKLPPNGPLLPLKGLHNPRREQLAPTCKPGSRRTLKPTKPAIQISDADRKRKILITDKCTMALKKWRET